MMDFEKNETERVRMPALGFDGKAGVDAPGEREIRRREQTERVYEKS